ncbi:sensor histidine kinase [Paenibacillus methanolicus]|uniref:histidine kinase n=1 Tax=Paenibacillus methanolicus TaxID=582686 RepID=A0A5S5BWJ0_9BACL|nr:ATP-binding protein [Paenibacillus methanolicus]TYP71407.1 diguanylate cyclase (GGDEF)-like protein [Paenibacillus methanolicus]
MPIIRYTRYVVVPMFTVIIAICSIVLGKSASEPLLFVSSVLFLGLVMAEKRVPYAFFLQLVTLALFHWHSQLNWTQILYYLLTVLAVLDYPKRGYTLAVSLLYSLGYTAVRLSYQPHTMYNLLVSFYDIVSFVLLIVLMRYLFAAEREKRQLRERNDYLSTHDPLTGLLNYEGWMEAMRNLTSRPDERYTLLLLDLQGFRSIGTIDNKQEILPAFSHALQQNFAHANIIARYAGDRFALFIPQSAQPLVAIKQVIESNRLGYEVLYSFAVFPDEGAQMQELVNAAEERLFQKKRQRWLKNEEDFFRSEKLRAVGELAAGMAHEIRNPLTTLRGFIDLSRSHGYNIERWFDVITQEITRMSELTGEFLQFSKPHISNMRLEPIGACIDRVRHLTESAVTSKGHTLDVDPVDDLVLIFMDRDKIVQVLLNLLRNAIEAMDEPGHIVVRTRVTASDVIIDIEDTGCGISEADAARIFDPFFTTKERGTGLGLSICRKIIEDHGGILTVRSQPGVGTVFTVELPRGYGE